jgi:hypothetical protein
MKNKEEVMVTLVLGDQLMYYKATEVTTHENGSISFSGRLVIGNYPDGQVEFVRFIGTWRITTKV